MSPAARILASVAAIVVVALAVAVWIIRGPGPLAFAEGPKVALVDPELTLDLPPALTASTGLDALTQLIEPYVSGRANPMTDGLCVEGIGRASRS